MDRGTRPQKPIPHLANEHVEQRAKQLKKIDEDALNRIRQIMGMKDGEIVPDAVLSAYLAVKRAYDRVAGRPLTDEALALVVGLGTVKSWHPLPGEGARKNGM